ERPRLVGSRQHHAAADRDGLAAQRRVEQLLDRGIEGIEVRMKDGGGGNHPGARPKLRLEHNENNPEYPSSLISDISREPVRAPRGHPAQAQKMPHSQLVSR